MVWGHRYPDFYPRGSCTCLVLFLKQEMLAGWAPSPDSRALAFWTPLRCLALRWTNCHQYVKKLRHRHRIRSPWLVADAQASGRVCGSSVSERRHRWCRQHSFQCPSQPLGCGGRWERKQYRWLRRLGRAMRCILRISKVSQYRHFEIELYLRQQSCWSYKSWRTSKCDRPDTSAWVTQFQGCP